MARLAAAIFGKPDMLLLDEPTNHLSIAAVLWLARELKESPTWEDRIIVVVSHDRFFLDEVCGDVLHVSLQFGLPEYSPSFDYDQSLSVPSRRRLLDTIQAEGALLISPHLPFPGVGRVEGEGTARAFAPLALGPPEEGKL